MRHIARDGKQPDPSWLAKADALLEQLALREVVWVEGI